MHASSPLYTGRALAVLAFFAALQPATASDNQREAHTVDICDLARALGSFDGKLVAVRGMYLSGRHGQTVAAEACPKPTPFTEFGSGIAIDLDVNLDKGSAVPGPNHRSYAVNRNAILEFQMKANSSSDSESVTATFIGVLHAVRGFAMHVTPNQGYEGNGFGHMGRYPAQLQLTTVRNAVFAAEPTSKR